MALTQSEFAHYRYLRACGYAAHVAKARAIDWIARGNRPNSPDSLRAWIGAPNESGARWIARPDRAGLRFVGFADEIAGLRNRGWYCRADDFGETYRGAVYQLPARKGRARYVPAYREGDTGRNGRDWRDTSGDPAALLDFASICEGDRLDSSWDTDSGKRDAARIADSIAERAAESSREYDESWQAGREFAELVESAQAARSQARELISQIRKARGDSAFCARFPAIAAALRSAIRDALETWQGDCEKARELWDAHKVNKWDVERNGRALDLARAFAEGAEL
jgi:hypothetical protein